MARDVSWLMAASLVEKGVMFLLFAGMGWRFGPEAVGEYAFLFAVAWFLQNIMDLGGFSYHVPQFARHPGASRPFWDTLLAKTLLFLALLPGVALFDRPDRFLPLLVAMALEGGVSLLRAWLHCRHRFTRQAMAVMVEKAVVLLCLAVAWVSGELLWVYWSLAAGKVGYALFVAREPGDMPPWQRPEPAALPHLVGESGSYILHAMAAALFFQVDVMLLKALGVPYQAIAWYAASTRIFTALNAFPASVQGVYYPALARALQQGDHSRAWALLAPYHRLTREAGGVLAVMVMLTAGEWAPWVFGPGFEEAGLLMIFMAPLLLPRFGRTAASAVLAGGFHNQARLRGTVLATVMVVLLDLVMIPAWGIWGAAFAAVLGETLMSVLFVGAARLLLPTLPTMSGELLALAGLVALNGAALLPALPRWGAALLLAALLVVRMARSRGSGPPSPRP